MGGAKKKKILQKILITEPGIENSSQYFAQVIQLTGNNFCEVRLPDERVLRCSIPKRLCKCVWIRRGDFLIVEIDDSEKNLKGEVVHILTVDHIKSFVKKGTWPDEFETKKPELPNEVDENTDSSDGELLFKNPNHQYSSEDDSSDDELLLRNPNHQYSSDDDSSFDSDIE